MTEFMMKTLRWAFSGKRSVIYFGALPLLFSCAVVMHAQGQSVSFSEGSKTIARLGMQGTTGYVSFVEPLRQNCLWGNIYIAPERKAMFAQLLAAKLAGKRLSRIDYSQPGGNGTQCNADLVEILD